MAALRAGAFLHHRGQRQRRDADDVHEAGDEHRLAAVQGVRKRPEARGAARQRERAEEGGDGGDARLTEAERAPDHQRETEIGDRQDDARGPRLSEHQDADDERGAEEEPELEPPPIPAKRDARAAPHQQSRRQRQHAQDVAGEESRPGQAVVRIDVLEKREIPGADQSPSRPRPLIAAAQKRSTSRTVPRPKSNLPPRAMIQVARSASPAA